MKEIYVLASPQAAAVSMDVLREVFESEDVEFLAEDPQLLFSVRSGDARVDVRFHGKNYQLPMNRDLLTGTEEAKALLKKSKGFYSVGFEPGKPQPSVAVFEALWCIRSIMEQLTAAVLVDMVSHKLHDAEDVVEITELEFDIRDHVNLHAVELNDDGGRLWVHSHGMEKFGVRDVEAFHLVEEDLLAAETFLNELCTDLAFGHGPTLRTQIETSEGEAFLLLPSEEARLNLLGLAVDTFEGHEGLFYTVVSAENRHTLSNLLKPYQGRFEKESPEEAEALRMQALELMPAFKARFQRKGLMEPLTFLVRAPFESHPSQDPLYEDLWVEVLTWDDEDLVGKLVDGGAHTTEWRKGAHVELEEEQVNAVALGRDGRTLADEDMRVFLLAEKPM